MGKRIVHAADYGSRVSGSFVPALCALAARLQERGDDMILVARDVEGAVWHARARDAGIELHLRRTAREIAHTAAQLDPHVAHAHFFGLYVHMSLAMLRRPGRLIWHVHSTVPNVGSVRERARGWLRYRVAGRRAEAIIAVSPAIAHELRVANAPAAKTHVIPNAIDTARFRPPSEAERAQSRAALGIGTDERVHLFFGRDRTIKGADTLWDALDRLAPAPPVRYIVVGAHDATLAEFERRVAVTAVAHVADTRPLYWAADALVMPSRGEGMPFVLLEALASGLPAAVSSIPAIREIVAGNANVVAAPPDDPRALAGALERLARIGPGPPALDARYGLERWVDGVIALYDAPDAGLAGIAK